MTQPYYDDGNGIVIYNADCRDILPTLGPADLVLTDPPYGMKWTGKVSVGANGHKPKNRSSHFDIRIIGDNQPFDPSPWLSFPRVILFGSNHFAARLPVGTTLIWIKRLDGGFGSFLSDAEIAWMKGGHGVYCHRDTSLRADARNQVHPSQKPVGLMKWCINKSSVPSDGLILDPFMGSGTTLVAAKHLGRRAIGIEVSEKYCQIAVERLRQSVFRFDEPATLVPTQEAWYE